MNQDVLAAGTGPCSDPTGAAGLHNATSRAVVMARACGQSTRFQILRLIQLSCTAACLA
jgi:hypothetical protein